MSAPEQLAPLLLGAVLDAEGPVMKTHAAALLDSCGVRPTDISDKRVRAAWKAADVLAARKRPVDAATVFATARTAGDLADGDLAWLQSLQASNALDSARFVVVAEQLRRSARSHQLSSVLRDEHKNLKDGADPTEVAARLESVTHALGIDHSRDGTGEEDVMELGAAWEARLDPTNKDERPIFLPSGVRGIDEAIGGFVANLNVILSQPSIGKSALLGSCIDGQIEQGIRPGLIGLEDGTIWLPERLLARDLGIPLRDVGHRRLEGELAERYSGVMQATANKLRLLTCYRHDVIGTAESLRRMAHWVKNLGVQCLYIDHGGEVEHPREQFQGETRLAVGESYRLWRNFGVRNKTPVVVLAHSNRPDNQRGDDDERPPRVTDIAESAYIERRARVILGLWERSSKPEQLRVTVLKNTKGERGRTYALKRLRSCALIDKVEWEELSVLTERKDEAKARRLEKAAAKQEEADAKAKLAAESKAAKEAAKAKKKPQLDLVPEVPPNGAVANPT